MSNLIQFIQSNSMLFGSVIFAGLIVIPIMIKALSGIFLYDNELPVMERASAWVDEDRRKLELIRNEQRKQDARAAWRKASGPKSSASYRSKTVNFPS